uniref:Uncharacterized protein n=1 Tax=Lepeophtheirus salmonis TaxID=72036 RepID=A0A0K2UZF1_LEPSM
MVTYKIELQSNLYRAVQNYLPIFVQNISRTIMTFRMT